MRKVVLFLFIIICTSLYSTSFDFYNFDLVKTFSIGIREDQLGYNSGFHSGSQQPGPTGIVFDSNGHFFIGDTWNNRIVQYDTNFNYVASLKDHLYDLGSWASWFYYPSGLEIIDAEILLRKLTSDSICLYKESDYKIIDFSNYGQNSSWLSFYFIDDNLLIERKDGSFNLIIDPFDSDELIILDHSQTKNYYSDIRTISLTENNLLMIDEIIFTGSYKKYIEYWNNKYNEEYFDQSFHIEQIQYPLNRLSSMTLIGTDQEFNVYWKGGSKWIYIFDCKGILIKVFSFDNSRLLTTPTIAPNGDVFFINKVANGLTLSKIAKKW